MSTFGTIFRVTTFGESHCRGVGCVIDGCPPGLELSEADVQPQLSRRRPGQSSLATPRSEEDLVSIMSGTEHGRTLGTPLAMFVPNLNVRPEDYAEMAAIPRPGHADYTYQMKYGVRASSGGGRSSARETIGRVAAGAVADKWLLQQFGTRVACWVTSVGDVEVPPDAVVPPAGTWTRQEIDDLGRFQILRDPSRHLGAGRASAAQVTWHEHWFLHRVGELPPGDAPPPPPPGGDLAPGDGSLDRDMPAYLHMPDLAADAAACAVYSADGRRLRERAGEELLPWCSGELVALRCPHAPTAARMATRIRLVRHHQDSTGGIVTCVISGVPVGLGEPCFDKLEAKLAHAMLSLPATKGFEIGSGFAGTRMRGSQHNDLFEAGEAAAAAAQEEEEEEQGAAPAKRARAAAGPGAAAAQPRLLRQRTNHGGGTLGGISSGSDIVFRVAIKPVSTIGQAQATATFDGQPAVLRAKGRHDPCVLPRAPPLVEAMASLVIMDAVLQQRARRPESLVTLAR